MTGTTTESDEARQARTAWFREARFGLFIHWGLYAILARGEWAMHIERIPPEEYAPLAQQFRPDHYDPAQWAAMAREAGMRYAVMTSRHHEGFSLFDSKVSEFTAPKTAAGRDLIAPYVEAFRQAGLKVGFYFSLLDWRWPAYWRGPAADPTGFAELVDYVHAQVRELCTQYGRLDLLWYDGAWPHSPQAWRSAELNAMVRSLQPHIIINDRAKLPEDYATPEQRIDYPEPGRLWESCMTMNDSWGYHAGDHNWKSVRQLIHNLVRCAHGGGNYLLNVGPLPDGTIPTPSVERLQAIGKWLRINGESIYGTPRSPYTRATFGWTTVKDQTIYCHATRWPGEDLCLAGVKNRAISARILATGDPVRIEQRGDRLFLHGLPPTPPDPYDTVIALSVEGPPAAC